MAELELRPCRGPSFTNGWEVVEELGKFRESGEVVAAEVVIRVMMSALPHRAGEVEATIEGEKFLRRVSSFIPIVAAAVKKDGSNVEK